MSRPNDSLAVAFTYHEETKHHPQRYARALGYLDWATQPDSFRRYEGATLHPLPRSVVREAVAYERLYDARGVASEPAGLAALADFLRHALAVSAWKRFGSSRWSLRVNPSSGNLHPTEAYLVLPALAETGAAGVFHYRPDVHALERRAAVEPAAWEQAFGGLPRGAFLVGLTSIAWREAWKYGERAFRYCQHDTGHALAALALSASLQGWRLVQQVSWSHAAIETVLGLDRVADFVDGEAEDAELIALVAPASLPPGAGTSREPGDRALAAWRAGAFLGKAVRLSRDHHPWPVVDEVARATRVPGVAEWATRPETLPEPAGNGTAGNDAALADAKRIAAAGAEAVVHEAAGPSSANASTADARTSGNAREPRPLDARALIQQRRSAVALDGIGSLPFGTFAAMLRRTLPGAHPPWSALPWRPRVDLALFVHRVEGLGPGLYYLRRSAGGVESLRAAMRREFAWTEVALSSATPASCATPPLPLFLLHHGDHRALAKHVSCHQDIAADGFFSLAMLADFAPALRQHGAWFYRHLFWETGVVGQVLYLEAEAAGARATGIGCFFDDAVHHVLGLQGNEWQSLYHFTVGMPVEDGRLTTEPGYTGE